MDSIAFWLSYLNATVMDLCASFAQIDLFRGLRPLGLFQIDLFRGLRPLGLLQIDLFRGLRPLGLPK